MKIFAPDNTTARRTSCVGTCGEFVRPDEAGMENSVTLEQSFNVVICGGERRGSVNVAMWTPANAAGDAERSKRVGFNSY